MGFSKPLSTEIQKSNFQKKCLFLKQELFDGFFLGLASSRTTGKEKEENEDEKMQNGETKEKKNMEK